MPEIQLDLTCENYFFKQTKRTQLTHINKTNKATYNRNIYETHTQIHSYKHTNITHIQTQTLIQHTHTLSCTCTLYIALYYYFALYFLYKYCFSHASITTKCKALESDQPINPCWLQLVVVVNHTVPTPRLAISFFSGNCQNDHFPGTFNLN